jgi:hypothetical protein
MQGTKKLSTAFVGTSAVLVIVGVLWMVLTITSGTGLFGGVLIGLGVALGVAGMILNFNRR